MRTIAAREIKRRGIKAVKEALKEGPVHIIKNDQPTFVVLDEEHYRELLEDQEQAYVARGGCIRSRDPWKVSMPSV